MGMDRFQQEINDASLTNCHFDDRTPEKVKFPGKLWNLPTDKILLKNIRFPTNLVVENLDDKKNDIVIDKITEKSRKWPSTENSTTDNVHTSSNMLDIENEDSSSEEEDIRPNQLSYGRGRGLRFQLPVPDKMVQSTAYEETSKIAQSLRSAYPTFKSTMMNRKINSRESLPSKDRACIPNKPNGQYPQIFNGNSHFIKFDKAEYISPWDDHSVSHLIEDYYDQSKSSKTVRNTVETMNLKSEDFPPLGFTASNSSKKSLSNGFVLQSGKEQKLDKTECMSGDNDMYHKSSSNGSHIYASASWTPDENAEVNESSKPVLMKFIIKFLPLTVSYEYLYDFLVSYGQIESIELKEHDSSSNANLEIRIDEYHKNLLMEFMNSNKTEDLFDFSENGPENKILCEIQSTS